MKLIGEKSNKRKLMKGDIKIKTIEQYTYGTILIVRKNDINIKMRNKCFCQ